MEENRSIIQFKGENIPSPSSVQIGIKDQDQDSDTNAQGEVERNRIAIKRTLSIEWGPLEWSEISKILQLVSDVYVKVNYPDPQTGKYEIKTFYVGDRPTLVALQDGNTLLWTGLKFEMVEK